MNYKHLTLLILFITGCSTTLDGFREHYVLKTCNYMGCRILDIYGSLSDCIEMKQQITTNAVICEGISKK